MISAAEALGVAVAVSLWGSDLLQSDSMVTVFGAKRWYSPSENLAKAMTFLVRGCMAWGLRPKISHVAGKSNMLADSLSRLEVDPEAPRALSWLHESGRASPEVLYEVLPELAEYLTPLSLEGCGAPA